MNFVRSNNLSLKYQRFTPSGSKDKGIVKIELVSKIQFLNRKLLSQSCSNGKNIRKEEFKKTRELKKERKEVRNKKGRKKKKKKRRKGKEKFWRKCGGMKIKEETKIVERKN